MSYRGPKAKRSRALGVALTPKAALVMNRRPNPPGVHGAGRKRQKSEYGQQLLEKQRLKYQYNVSEKQLRNYFKEAKRQPGNTGEHLLKLLESRLDSIVYRAGYAATIYGARQLVTHGHINVNDKRVNRPAFLVKLTDILGLRDKAKTNVAVLDSLTKANRPAYIDYASEDKATARFNREPTPEEIPVICRMQMVVEFYSR